MAFDAAEETREGLFVLFENLFHFAYSFVSEMGILK